MFIVLDYKCEKCGNVEERMVRKSERDSQKCSCGGRMSDKPSATAWSYSSSCGGFVDR